MKNFLSCFLILLSFTYNIYAQSSELNNAYQNKTTYLNQKDFVKAIQWGEKALGLAEKEFGKSSASYANYASDLASLYQLQNDLDKAEKLYLISFKIYAGFYGEEHVYTSTSAFNLGIVYESLNHPDKAELYYWKSLNGYIKSRGREDPYYAMALNYLMVFYSKINQNEKLEKQLKSDLEYFEKTYGKKREYVAGLNNQALNYYYSKKFTLAEASYLEALKVLESMSYQDSDIYADISKNLYYLYLERAELEKALPHLKTAINYEAIGSTKGGKEHAILLSHLGELYRNISNYPEAEKSFLEALAMVEKSEGKSSLDYAVLLNNLGYLYRLMGNYDKSEKYLTEALAAHEKTGGKESAEYAIVLNNSGLLKVAQGNYEKAENFYTQALSIQKKNAADQSYASTLNNCGLLYYYMGKFSKALHLLNEALEVKGKTIGPRHYEYANTLVNIALVHVDQGNYLDAERLFKESLEIYKNSVGESDFKYANALTNLGQLYYNLGQFGQALTLHTQALMIKEKTLGKEHPEYATSLNFVGICFLSLDRLPEAKKYFTHSLDLRKKIFKEDHPDVGVCWSNLSLVYLKEGNYKEAAALLEKTIEIERKSRGEDNLTYATYLNNLGSVYLMQKSYARSKELFLQTKNIREKKLGKNHILMADVLGNLANVYDWTEDYAGAEPYYLQANEIYYANIKNKFPFLSEKDKEAFFFQFEQHINSFYAFCIERSKDNPSILEHMYNNQLNFKALLLNETKNLRKHMQNQQDLALKTLYEKWINQREYLAKLYTLTLSETEKRGIDLFKEEQKANDLEKEFSAKSQYFAQSSFLKNYTWKDVQKNLLAGEAVVEVIQFDQVSEDSSEQSSYVALAVSPSTKSHPQLVLFSIGNELEGKHFSYYINSIKHKSEDLRSYERYWTPLNEALKNETNLSKVYISLDGVFNKLSLKALKNPATKKYLADELDVHLLSNSKLLCERITVTSPVKLKKCELYGFPDYVNNEESAFGNFQEPGSRTVVDTLIRYFQGKVIPDLPGTESEVNEISKILKGKGVETKVFLRKNASEERLKKTSSPDILHIATHGFFMTDEEITLQEDAISSFELVKLKHNPLLRSGLLLAGVSKALMNKEKLSGEDGIFTAYEAMHLDLANTQLVVLSACETGLGEIENGEGVYGLQRALEISGAQSLLMSLWTVDDEATRELMVLFYKEWMETGKKRESFNKAQKMLREKYKDPYYWAAFILIGE